MAWLQNSDANQKPRRENENSFSPPAHSRSEWRGGVRGGGHFVWSPREFSDRPHPGSHRFAMFADPPRHSPRSSRGVAGGGERDAHRGKLLWSRRLRSRRTDAAAKSCLGRARCVKSRRVLRAQAILPCRPNPEIPNAKKRKCRRAGQADQGERGVRFRHGRCTIVFLRHRDDSGIAEDRRKQNVRPRFICSRHPDAASRVPPCLGVKKEGNHDRRLTGIAAQSLLAGRPAENESA